MEKIRILKVIDEPEKKYTLSAEEEERKKVAIKKDKYGLMATGKTMIDHSKDVLVPPDNVKEFIGKGLNIAQNIPEIEFAVIPYKYRYFGPDRIKDNSNWSSWSQAGYDVGSETFFGAVGDHGWTNAHLHLVEYDIHKKKLTCLPEVNKALGRKINQFGDGKIHGYLDVYKPSFSDNRQLWFCTYWCHYPEPLDSDFETGYAGGHIMSWDLEEKHYIDYGVPLERASWPFHRVDRKRGILYAIGMFSEFLAWDIDSQQIKWAGYLPPVGTERDKWVVSPGMKWYNRCMLLDEHTGSLYSNNLISEKWNIIEYNPHKNRFHELDIDTKLSSPMRCHTRERDKEGYYWGLTAAGELFSFHPDKPEFNVFDKLWPMKDTYSASMDASPGGRYLYFGIASHARSYAYGSPVLQYDKKTAKTKILCFLFPYYYQKYGYVPGGTYSFKLNDTGDKLFMLWNGKFAEINDLYEKMKKYDVENPANWSVPQEHDAFGDCSIFVINIPEEEREE